MNVPTLIGYGVAAVIIVLVFWLRTRRSRRPIRNKGYGMLIPLVILLIVFGLSIHSMTLIPNHPFILPAWWEMCAAALLGVGLGSLMLYHTGYEKREDGQVYAKPNKNFKFVLIAVIIIRVALSQYFKGLDYVELSLLTMVMAFLYICVWRVGSFLKFRRVYSTAV
ncbi:CcdC protein domain-containing protein [Paenibacillus aestuarii]|uniref:CcdC protein domain-containing protein n=1 Tax=Paenibacillus aestuarii TaxID=516965 RepID=A0ABW0K069_9BACL|nr:CcdC protein domain-containing protein [Paenibacillus aestuarii]